jgi:hypothetical protein
MSDTFDLRQLLRDWPYEPANDARLVRPRGGREVLQVRTPLGIEQLEMEGRPDGLRPHGHESVLEFQLQRLAQARAAGREAEFELDPQACAELFGEGTLYYFRYLRLFQLKCWAATVRDTTRNLRLFDFVRQYAARDEDRLYLEKWRPYILRMNASAAALLTLDKGAHGKALEIVQTAITRIESLEVVEDETFAFERGRSLTALRELAAQIQRIRPVSTVERLEQRLRRAIDQQEFERAAELRDRLRDLRGGSAAK